MSPRPSSRATLTIESLAVGGDGVAHLDVAQQRRAVFVPQVAPGEIVEVELDLSSTPARGRVKALLQRSPSRREAPCPHAGRCGGCPWMFLDEAGQREARFGLLRDTVLRALGGEAPQEITLHEAPLRERYRSRARMAFSGRRGLIIGYRRSRSHAIERFDSCLVLVPVLELAAKQLSRWLQGCRGEGEVSLALGADGKAVLDLTWERGEPPPEVFARIEKAVQMGELAGATILSDGAKHPATIGAPVAWTEGADGAQLEAPAFAQAHPGVAAQIGAHLRAVVGQGRPSVVELFAGAGTFTVALAPGNPLYTAVEESASSCQAARRNLKHRGLEHVNVVSGDAETWEIPPKTSIVVLDPPRTGARKAAIALGASRVREVAYVSCDPVTLSRDLRALISGGFRVRSLHGFDLFPHTSHLEVVAHLERP